MELPFFITATLQNPQNFSHILIPGEVPWRWRSHFSSLVGSGSFLDITAHVFLQWVEKCWCERNEYRGCFARMTTWFYGVSLQILSANFILELTKYVLISSSRSNYAITHDTLQVFGVVKLAFAPCSRHVVWGGGAASLPEDWDRWRKKLWKKCHAQIIPNQFEKLPIWISEN
jgi:hypothetical protein